jgi:hypothetical protein
MKSSQRDRLDQDRITWWQLDGQPFFDGDGDLYQRQDLPQGLFR